MADIPAIQMMGQFGRGGWLQGDRRVRRWEVLNDGTIAGLGYDQIARLSCVGKIERDEAGRVGGGRAAARVVSGCVRKRLAVGRVDGEVDGALGLIDALRRRGRGVEVCGVGMRRARMRPIMDGSGQQRRGEDETERAIEPCFPGDGPSTFFAKG